MNPPTEQKIVQPHKEKNVSFKTMLDNRSGTEGGALLHGSDIPVGTKTITIAVVGIRESPDGFAAPAIIDLKVPIYGKSSWAVNRTNLRVLMKLFGDDETALVDRKVKLEVVSVRNPKTSEIVRSLAVSLRQ
jgi:hypothetical protein